MYSSLPVFRLAILSGLLSLLVGGVAARRARSQSRLVAGSFAGVVLSGLVWAGGYAGYLLADPAESYALLRWLWLGAVPYISCWFVFILAYTGRDDLLTRPVLAVVAIEPVVVLAVALSTPAHELFVGSGTVGAIGEFAVLQPVPGPVFVFHQTYLFLLANAALLFLVWTLGDTDPAYHPQVLALLIAGSVPLFEPIQQLFDPSTAAIHGTPLLLSVAFTAILVGVVQYRLFDILPAARNRVLSTMEDGVVLVDEEGRIRIANTAARRQLSLPEPVIGQDAATVLPCGEDLLRFSEGELPDATMPTASPDSGSPRTDGGDGQLRPHPSGVELILDDGGEETHFIVSTEPVPVDTAFDGQLLVFRDITEQREQELEFQAVIEHTTDVVTIVDPEGRISYVSPSVESELSYTQLQLVGREITDLLYPDDAGSLTDDIESVSGTDETIHSQYRIKAGDDSWRMIETTVRGSRSSPTTDGVIITARDVTERLRNQQRRQVMNRVLRHDLRNDMNVVVGHAEILVEALDSERVRHAETIRQKASSLVDLGEKVRKIDQRLHGRDRELQEVDLSRIVEDEVRSVHQSYPETSIRTRIEGVSIWGDTLVRAAVENLIENAIEHNDHESPEIDVVVTETDDRVELVVSDNGPGIPEAERRVITAGIETPLEHISGLGLWLVKWIVEGMDGDFEIEDNEPRGSVVTLSFPTVAAAGDRSAEPIAGGSEDRPVEADQERTPIGTTTRSGSTH
ncbi:histidine kinase N-terminal 7TM domain-containing protein [Halohasta salina]|uniref:histidine kinase N-terminal 7TM domain-containing protein n=1 Tax=Halohasta salina TaxID=2961621 RepID=UPI0020A38948|nr:histidine kinase N-terminal 7TM domain-containing protein [Halohasta salina]